MLDKILETPTQYNGCISTLSDVTHSQLLVWIFKADNEMHNNPASFDMWVSYELKMGSKMGPAPVFA